MLNMKLNFRERERATSYETLSKKLPVISCQDGKLEK